MARRDRAALRGEGRRERGGSRARIAFFSARPDAPATAALAAPLPARAPSNAGWVQDAIRETGAAPRFAIGAAVVDARLPSVGPHAAAALRARQARRDRALPRHPRLSRHAMPTAWASSPQPLYSVGSTRASCGASRRRRTSASTSICGRAIWSREKSPWARTIRMSIPTSCRGCGRSSPCCSRRASSPPTPWTASSSATRATPARWSAPARWRARGPTRPTGACSSRTRRRRWPPSASTTRCSSSSRTRPTSTTSSSAPCARAIPGRCSACRRRGTRCRRTARARSASRASSSASSGSTSRPRASCASGTRAPRCATWCCRSGPPAPSGSARPTSSPSSPATP